MKKSLLLKILRAYNWIRGVCDGQAEKNEIYKISGKKKELNISLILKNFCHKQCRK